MPSRIQSRKMTPAAVLCLLLLAGALGGCGIFSPEETKEVDQTIEPYPAATTPNQLVQNFVDAHVDRNFPEYEKLLDAGFEFKFANEDIDASETPDGIWDRARDVESADAMFNGKEGKLNPDTGENQSPVQSISATLSPIGAWRDDAPPEIEADQWREYRVDMSVNYANLDIAEVAGIQRLYIKWNEEEGVWKLRRWEDQGNPDAEKQRPSS